MFPIAVEMSKKLRFPFIFFTSVSSLFYPLQSPKSLSFSFLDGPKKGGGSFLPRLCDTRKKHEVFLERRSFQRERLSRSYVPRLMIFVIDTAIVRSRSVSTHSDKRRTHAFRAQVFIFERQKNLIYLETRDISAWSLHLKLGYINCFAKKKRKKKREGILLVNSGKESARKSQLIKLLRKWSWGLGNSTKNNPLSNFRDDKSHTRHLYTREQLSLRDRLSQ